MGAMVNLSARIMALAGDNDVLIDEETRKAAEKAYIFQDLGPTKFKGMTNLINVYRPLGPKKAKEEKKDKVKANPMQCRDDVCWKRILSCNSRFRQEFKRLQDMVKQDERGVVIVLTGERGSGKSALVDVWRICSIIL